MRISTPLIYYQATDRLNRQQAELFRLQQQLSTGRRILSPADDPAASARAAEISQSKSINTQYGENRGTAGDSLRLLESTLSGVTEAIQQARAVAVNAGSPSLSARDRESLATELDSLREQLLGLANSRDGAGQYLFSGFQGATKPFVETVAGVQYQGDQGTRALDVAPGRTMGISQSGVDVFMRIRNGNGVFVAAPAAGNAGSGVIGPGSVVNPATLTGQDYRIDFSVAGGVTTYSVTNLTTSTTLSSGNPYQPGAAILVDGMQVDVNGAPANGDRFTLTPSRSQDVFATLSSLSAALRAPTPAGAPVPNGVNAALTDLDQALDRALTVRGQVGSQLKELEALQSIGEDLDLRYQESLSRLQDLDFAKAISDFSQQQVYLEAAQRSFLSLSGLSLFNFLK